MSTKNTTSGSNSTAFQFNPQTMTQYLSNLNATMPFLRSNVSNPFGSDAFKQESTANQDQATQLGQRNKSNILNNAAAMGYNTNGGLINSMLARAGRDTSNLQAQGFRSAVANANTRQMQSAGMLNAFQPLMTGSNGNFNSTQTTSGLGTWLPQLAGAALGAATGGLTGGLTSSAGALGMGLPNKVAPVSVPNPFNIPGMAGTGVPNSLFAGIGSMPPPTPYGYH